MTPNQHRNIIVLHGPIFHAELCTYLIKLSCYRWAEQQLKKGVDNFYDDKWVRELLHNHDVSGREVWEALARCRELRSRQPAPDRLRVSELSSRPVSDRDRARDDQGMLDLPLFGGLK